MKLLLVSLILSSSVFSLQAAPVKAANTGGYLSEADQKYYKNDSFEGNNQRERIDSAVVEINKMYGEMAALKAQVQQLRKEVDELKKK